MSMSNSKFGLPNATSVSQWKRHFEQTCLAAGNTNSKTTLLRAVTENSIRSWAHSELGRRLNQAHKIVYYFKTINFKFTDIRIECLLCACNYL